MIYTVFTLFKAKYRSKEA